MCMCMDRLPRSIELVGTWQANQHFHIMMGVFPKGKKAFSHISAHLTNPCIRKSLTDCLLSNPSMVNSVPVQRAPVCRHTKYRRCTCCSRHRSRWLVGWSAWHARPRARHGCLCRGRRSESRRRLVRSMVHAANKLQRLSIARMHGRHVRLG